MIHYIKPFGGTWRAINSTLIDEEFGWEMDTEFKSWIKVVKHQVKLKGADYDFVKVYEQLGGCMLMDYKIEDESVIQFEGYLNLKGEYFADGKLFIGDVLKKEKYGCLTDDEINLFDYAPTRYNVMSYKGTVVTAFYKKVDQGQFGSTITGDGYKYEHDMWRLIYDENSVWVPIPEDEGGSYQATLTHKIWVREEYAAMSAPAGSWKLVYDGGGIVDNIYARLVPRTKNPNIYEHPDIYTTKDIKSWTYMPDVTFTNGIKLTDVLVNLFAECSETLYSEFFGNDALTISNPVYDLVSTMFANIYLYQVSHIIKPDADTPATKMIVAKKKFLEAIIEYFNLEMWKDTNVYMEHKSWKQRLVNLDVSAAVEYTSDYKYTPKTIEYEEWLHQDGATNKNFKSVRLEYIKNCLVDIEMAQTTRPIEILYTDILSIVQNVALWDADKIEKNSVVMIMPDASSVINRSDTVFEYNVINGGLSFGYLINHLYNYVREQKRGNIYEAVLITQNGYIFNNLTSSGKAFELNMRMKYSDYAQLTPYNIIATPDGGAMITSLEWADNICKFKLEYL